MLDEGSSPHFVSAQNGGTPAVDTIAVGKTVEWTCRNFDYDNHRIESVGTPSFPATPDMNYYCEANHTVVTFSAPGTYRYEDFYHRLATGTIVVR